MPAEALEVNCIVVPETVFGIISNTFCEIPMYILTSSPYSLPQGVLIQATVSAINSIGTGLYSTFNTVGEFA